MLEGVAPGESVLVEVFPLQDKGGRTTSARPARAGRREEELQAQGPRMQEGVAPGESVLTEVFQSQDKGGEEGSQAQGPRVQECVKKNCKRKARACRRAWPRASRC
ncbi:hypothetical protein PF005_g25546 [Phytophthora fragariae]|uniref:Uncharacterized protein n=1 Tax=Phytophthora fragariae TaxID=53985 RepID=A0A6A3W8C6_9STRA|nr:hypothetical protein PF009_g26246 [Phytophthora fragariae]KAE9175107.1 hypothetical protein PF005_g25546 [Phytophthora fragariae]KAE9181597.1 hypothetical protein PF004_g24495 [Phytophthora fragariae]